MKSVFKSRVILLVGCAVAAVCGISGCGGGSGEETVLVATSVGSVDTPNPGASDAAIKRLEDNGVHVRSYRCNVANALDDTGLPLLYIDGVLPVVVLAEVSASDAARIDHSQRPDPFIYFGVYSPKTLWLIGPSFDCKSRAGW